MTAMNLFDNPDDPPSDDAARMGRTGVIRSLLFAVLRAYVAIEQSAFVRWLRGSKPDIVLEPLPTPDTGVPEVHDAPTLFVDSNAGAAYAHSGRTLRRVAQDEGGNLVYIRKMTKSEKKAAKRSNRRQAAQR